MAVFPQFSHNDKEELLFEKVYEVNLSKEEIHSTVNEWIALNFNDSNNVIKMNSGDKIVTNGQLSVPFDYQGVIQNIDFKFSMITDFKEGRYKVLVENIEPVSGLVGPTINLGPNYYALEEFKELTLLMFKQMGKRMLKQGEKMVENDEKIAELYENSKIYNQDIVNKVKASISGIANSLNSSVQNSTTGESDW